MTKAKVSQQKRSRERAKQEKRQQKAERKRLPGGEDPDLAGIVPGPQPSPWGEDEETEDEGTE
jgi:hypothetical protein